MLSSVPPVAVRGSGLLKEQVRPMPLSSRPAPGRAPLIRDLRYALWVLPYLLCFLLMEALTPASYHATQLPIDRWIPYASWAVVPYLSWYGFLALIGIWCLRRDRAAFRRYMTFLSAACLISVVCFLLFPNGQDLRPASPDGLFGPVVALLYRIDTPTNVFPSGHVTGCIGGVLAVRDALDGQGRMAYRLVTAYAVLICASTLLLKQHSVLDVLGAAVLSAAVGTAVYGGRPIRAGRPGWDGSAGIGAR